MLSLTNVTTIGSYKILKSGLNPNSTLQPRL